MGVFFIIAYHNLVQARRRTALLALGLAFVTFMLVSLLGLSRSISDQLLRAATTLSTGHINVGGFHKAKPSEATPLITGRSAIRQAILAEAPGIAAVIDRYRGWVQISSETDSLQAGVAGVAIEDEPRLVELLQLVPEAAYHKGGSKEIRGDVWRLAEPDTIVIFESQAKQLNVTVGDQLTLITQRPDGITNTRDVRVVAVARDMSLLSNWTVFAPKQVLRDLYGFPEDSTGAFHVFLRDPDRAEDALAHLRTALTKRGFALMEYNPQPFFMKFEIVAGEDWIGQRLDLTYWKDEVTFLVWILTIVNAISVLLVGILLVIIGVGIMNTMWIAVRERTNEIGTLRAIGMSRARVLRMFLLEALLLGLFATAVGALLAAGVAALVNAAGLPLPPGPMRAFLMSDRLQLNVTAWQALDSALVITLVTCLAALWPAIRASRLQPITAIHTTN